MNTNENEPILDAMLDELLGKRQPRLIGVDSLCRQPIDPQRATEFEQAIQAAAADMRRRSIISPASKPKKRKSRSPVFRVLASLAACLLIGAGVWAFTNKDRLVNKYLNQQSVAVNQAESNKAIDPARELSRPDSSPKKKTFSEAISSHSLASNHTREPLSLESLPFGTQDPTPSKQKTAGSDRGRVAAKWSESETIAAIDSQMQQLWKNHDAKPAAPISGVAWIERVCKQLLARPATQEDKDTFAKKDSPSLRLASLHRIVDSPEFSQVWAKNLAGHYLGIQGTISTRDITNDRRNFVQWIRKEIAQSHGLDSIAKNIVLSAGNNGASPSSHWWSEIGLRSPTAATEVLASSFLGIRSSCSRCHDANAVAKTDQAQFWGLAAITQGIEVTVPGDSQKASIGFRSLEKPLFFERKDAALVAALPSLPNGEKLKTPQGTPEQVEQISKQNLSAFSNWMAKSDELAQSHTNFVWEMLFGEPLISNYPLDASEGASERKELAGVLSQQLRSNNNDLCQIVVWIAASKAFSLESFRTNNDWYLTASDKDLRAYQQRQRLMATFPVRQDPSFRTLDKLAQWIDSSSLKSTESGSILANPLPLSPIPNKPMLDKSLANKKASNFTESQVQFLIGSQTLPVALQDEVERLLKQNLPWNALLDHAFYMTGSTPPLPSDREAAQRILELSRDKRLALNRIITARL